MIRSALLSASLLIASIQMASAATTPDPAGLWLTENKRAAVKIERCGDSICGSLAWIIEGGMTTDSKNPDKSLRDKPLCGMKILYGFKNNPKNTKVWESGNIYKADEGDVYNATVSVISDTTLRLRGYVGMPLFGKTQDWTRVSAKDYPACKK